MAEADLDLEAYKADFDRQVSLLCVTEMFDGARMAAINRPEYGDFSRCYTGCFDAYKSEEQFEVYLRGLHALAERTKLVRVRNVVRKALSRLEKEEPDAS